MLYELSATGVRLKRKRITAEGVYPGAPGQRFRGQKKKWLIRFLRGWISILKPNPRTEKCVYRLGTASGKGKGPDRVRAFSAVYPNSGCSPLAAPKRKTHFRPAHRFGMYPRKNRMSRIEA